MLALLGTLVAAWFTIRLKVGLSIRTFKPLAST